MSGNINSVIATSGPAATVLTASGAWLTTNSTAITVATVLATGIASICFGIWNARTGTKNAKANQERNEINYRNITDQIISDLRAGGENEETINKVKNQLRK